MATLTVNGVKVTVDDNFRNLTPEQQEATVNEIAASLGGQQEQALPVEGGYSSGPSWTQPITAFGRGVADTFSGGWIDEVGALADYAGSQILPWRDPLALEQARNQGLADDKALAEANPGSMLTGQVVGGLALGSQIAKRGLSPTANAAPGASLMSRVGRGFGEGAVMGGIYGLGSGEGVGDRLEQGALNAGIGGAVGAAVPLVAKGASEGYRSIMDRRAANQAAEKAGASPEVARLLTQVMESDGTLGQQGARNMYRAGNEAMLADAGPNARRTLDAAIQRGGKGSVLAGNRISERVGRGARDLTTVLDDTMGAPQGVHSAREAIRTGTAGARGAAYDDAFSKAIDYAAPQAREIEELVKGRVPGSAIRRANELMRLEGAQSRQILANIADDGSVTFERLPDVRQLDYITRALNDVASEADGAGKLGGTTALGRAYENLSRDIRSRLRTLVPEYGNALDTAADAIERSNALRIGDRALSPSVPRDEFASMLRGMSKGEKQNVAQGIRSRIDEKLSNVTRAVQDGDMDAREAIKGLKDLSSRAAREKVTAVIGDEPAKRLFQELDRITTSFELRAAVAENSKTFARQATDEMIKSEAAPGAIRTLAGGRPLNAAQRIAQALTGQTDEAVKGRETALASQIADFLTRPAKNAIPAFRAMTDYGAETVANQLRANEIARLLSSGQRLVYPTSGQLTDSTRR